jgi:outer membrane protein assembly factor BamB
MRSIICRGVIMTMVAMMTAAAGAAAGDSAGQPWPMSRFDSAQTAFNANERSLGARNVSQLHLLATVPLANQFGDGVAVVHHGMAFVASYSLNRSPGRLEAFSSNCGGAAVGGAAVGGAAVGGAAVGDFKAACVPLWTAVVGRYSGGTVAVADGLVFAGGDNGADPPAPRLYVFPERCRQDGRLCQPLWHADLPGSGELHASPTVSAGVVYVPAGTAGTAYLFALPVHCLVGAGKNCVPLWRGKMDLGDALQSVAVSHGFAYVPDYDGYLYAFQVNCASKGGVCNPAWLGYTHELGPSAAAVGGGLVFVGSQDENVYAFNEGGCGSSGGACPPLWRGATRGNVRSMPAVAYGTVFFTSDDGNLYAFPEHCAASCRPNWTAPLGVIDSFDSFRASPAVANGVVYVSSSNGGSSRAILAFPALCGIHQARCEPLWTSDADSYFLFEGPSIAGGRVYATAGPSAGPGQMFVFGLPFKH